MQVQGLRWSDEVGIGRHGCCTFELSRLQVTDGALGPVTAVTDSSVLAEPDLGSIFEATADLILVSSRPREPIEKPWMRVP